VNEAKLKSLLDSIASFAMIPHGYQRHKDRIVRLAEDVLAITRKGWPTTSDVPQRFVTPPPPPPFPTPALLPSPQKMSFSLILKEIKSQINQRRTFFDSFLNQRKLTQESRFDALITQPHLSPLSV
jgi:hypothetical protein